MAVRKCLVYTTILLLGIFHVIVCLKYEHKLGLLIAFPMIFELVLLYSGIQASELIYFILDRQFLNFLLLAKI